MSGVPQHIRDIHAERIGNQVARWRIGQPVPAYPVADGGRAESASPREVGLVPFTSIQLPLQPPAEVVSAHAYRILDMIRRCVYYVRMTEITQRFRAVQLGETIEGQGRTKRWVAAQVGIHETMLAHLIAGRRTVTEPVADSISKVLGVPLFLLFVSADAAEMAAPNEGRAA